MDKLKLAEQSLVNEDLPEFEPGDTVNIHYLVREGEKERIQHFEGLVISRRGSGSNQTFIVRKISAGNIGVERIFPLNSPFISKIDVKKRGDVRRAKLFYLRERQGKSARIKEKDRAATQRLEEREQERIEAREAAAEEAAAQEAEAAEASAEEQEAEAVAAGEAEAGQAESPQAESPAEEKAEKSESPEVEESDEEESKAAEAEANQTDDASAETGTDTGEDDSSGDEEEKEQK